MLFNQRELPNSALAAETARLAALIVDMERLQRGVLPEALAGADAPILDHWMPFRTGCAVPGRSVHRASHTDG